MAHNIPKIEYGGFIPTVITFDYPPIEEGNESLDAKERVTVSLSGKRQVLVDYVEAVRNLKFSFLSESLKESLKTFFLTHAYLGNSFKYYDDKNSSEYKTYELSTLQFTPKKVGIVTANTYRWEVPFKFRRVVDEEVINSMIATINNNVTTATDVTDMLLDSASYKSAKVFFEIFRKTDSEERVANGWLTAVYYTATNSWDITPGGSYDGNETGVIFSITAAGQVKYTSDNMAGTNYSGQITFKEFTFA